MCRNYEQEDRIHNEVQREHFNVPDSPKKRPERLHGVMQLSR